MLSDKAAAVLDQYGFTINNPDCVCDVCGSIVSTVHRILITNISCPPVICTDCLELSISDPEWFSLVALVKRATSGLE